MRLDAAVNPEGPFHTFHTNTISSQKLLKTIKSSHDEFEITAEDRESVPKPNHQHQETVSFAGG